ncbi:unnamed protein product [Arabidopsis lyrata]|uniref:Expressed protein n=1 Tax=Arabidopsis lyrata subsp. lyrata TaxID=81972 RepID=D7MBC6_ARALL|nr:expressed protein [Arabidopsis lyrata subsp. lyrata]CAH8276654.1 unnamed protein product [Arabidopsis lyrata]
MFLRRRRCCFSGDVVASPCRCFSGDVVASPCRCSSHSRFPATLLLTQSSSVVLLLRLWVFPRLSLLF